MNKKGLNSIRVLIMGPVILLAALAIISNAMGISRINNVNEKATTIADKYMVSVATLGEIQRATESIHKQALAHIVAIDLSTKIERVTAIKEESKQLEANLTAYKQYINTEENEVYNELLSSNAVKCS